MALKLHISLQRQMTTADVSAGRNLILEISNCFFCFRHARGIFLAALAHVLDGLIQAGWQSSSAALGG